MLAFVRVVAAICSLVYKKSTEIERRRVFVDLDQMSENVHNGAALVWRRRKKRNDRLI